ncbi:sterol carrier family protein [Lysinibacter sp. HNR]|uniref:sterol carrier family protein n=1 Tax=Lysinibacter sp. HNR TaxID=3031408 RepID=UPI00243550F6|nr:sterol carrier family protein [Lysinibacter sp. HNR]WGD37727.1 sterol carrier family protein [Lysinibacter sp. HNR]
MARRNISDADGAAALRAFHEGNTTPSLLATAVRWTLQTLAITAPGNTVEVRVPPYAAVQCIEGPRHTRGTPPNVVETDAETWLSLWLGELSWTSALVDARVRASGQRADLSAHLPGQNPERIEE